MSQQPGRNDACSCGSGKKYKKCCEGKTAAQPSLPQTELGQLVALFQAGRYLELERLARVLLERKPSWGVVWKILGTAQGIQGKDAVPALEKAAQLLPEDADVHNNLGNALKELRRFNDAIASYRRALEIAPNYADAHNNLGNALKDCGQLDRAVECYRQALALMPEDAEVHNNLGVVLKMLGQFDAAMASYQGALALVPNYAEAYNNLGNALRSLGQIERAAVNYRHALAIRPSYFEAHSNLGVVLKDLGQYDGALASYQRALALKPDYAEAHNNLGSALQDLGQFDNAELEYRRALSIKPDFAEAHNNLGSVLKDLGRFSEALDCFRQALSLKPDYVEARSNLLFALNFSVGYKPATYLEKAREYGRVVARNAGERYAAWQCTIKPNRLRVGFVSGDLKKHPVGFFLESLLAQLDPAQVELLAYPTNVKADELTARIKPHFAAWKPICGQSDKDVAGLIHADGVHILFDLSGHTAHNRLPVFAWKPAPVQVSWLGYFATTGMTEMDYLLADAVGVPEAQHDNFTERVWYLPDTRLCFSPPQYAVSVTPLPAIMNGGMTFGCFQNLAKVSDPVLSLWGRVLTALPGARLRLSSKQLGDPVVAVQFTQRLQQQGIDPARVALLGAVSREEYLAAHAEVDVMLDTFPYPGGTTTCEALWMGVPTLTLAGETLLARQGASLLTAAGLSDWVANSEAKYIEKAIQFASDLSALAALRAGLREQVLASPLFDAPRFARNFEAALWVMWRTWGEAQ